MPADMNRRLNRIVVAISQNEALMGDLETGAASTLLEWASSLVSRIAYETIEIEDEETADIAMYPRLRALRQMMRQINQLVASADPETAAATLESVIAQSATVYGDSFIAPTPERKSAFLNIPPVNTAEWITFLRAWLENSPTP